MTTKKLRDYSEYKEVTREMEEHILGGPFTFAMAVEALRVLEKISQSALARKIGISRQYLCDVEKGRRFVSPEQAARFAKAFGHPPNVLVQLCLEDSVRNAGLKLRVRVEAA